MRVPIHARVSTVLRGLEISAYHEAGHAVVGRILGLTVESVSIVPDETRGTIEWYSAGQTRFSSPLRDRASDANVEELERNAIMLLAGEAAQRKWSPRSVQKHCIAGDRLVIKLMVSEFEIPRLRKIVCKLVSKHWFEVESLANELLELGTVTLGGKQ